MWIEKETPYSYHIIENQGGKTLGYCPSSGVKIIEKDGFAFKDLAKTGELLPYEDWRLPADVRAEDLANRLSVEQTAGLMCYSVHQINMPETMNEAQKAFLDQHLRSVLNSAGLGVVNNPCRAHSDMPLCFPPLLSLPTLNHNITCFGM